MNQHKTLAIVLNVKVVGEDDRNYTFYTEKYGKISLLAEGASKIKAKLSGHLDKLNLVEIIFTTAYQNRLITALVKDSFLNIKRKLKPLQSAFMIAELVDEYTLFNQKDSNLWQLFLNSLYFLEENSNKFEEVADFTPLYFNAQLLNILGVAPFLEGCVVCGSQINTHFFSFKEKGLVCQKHKKETDLKIDSQKIRILQTLSTASLDKFKKPQIILKVLKEKKFLNQFLEKFTFSIKSVIM